MARFGWERRGDVVRNLSWHTVTVKSGQTLAQVASSVNPAQDLNYIKKWNGMATDTLKAGQSLKLYPYYTVQWGDTANDIARSFNITLTQIKQLNPWIKNINLIYPKEKIRLPEGREPEEQPPPTPAAPVPAPPPEKSELTADTRRTGAANSYADDDFPAHRALAGDYILRLGDCQFVVPPEFIQVYRAGHMFTGRMLRQRDNFKVKNGQSSTRIEIQLWFTNLEEINGFRIPSPFGNDYFMDGFRSMIAQFKRQPFLPIVNEFLNEVLNIHVVALQNISFTTVEGFPDVLQANLTLAQQEVDVFINKPSWTYDQHFMYPLFRWYYQQMLVEKGSTYSTTYLKPVEDANFTGKIKFKVLNEGLLRETDASKKAKDFVLDKAAYDDIELPDDLILTGIFGNMGTILAPLIMDMKEHPSYQYMGGADTMFQLTFETANRDGVAVLERLFTQLERYSRQYRNKFVSGYVQVENDLINMCGVKNVMLNDLKVSTVPGFPDLFRIDISVVSFRANQYQDQRVNGYNMMSSEDASVISAKKVGATGAAEKYLHNKQEPWFITEEGIAEGLLDALELYPDLELPPYKILNGVLEKINAFRKQKGQKVLPVTKYAPPKHRYRKWGSNAVKDIHVDDNTYADPDFYFTYPEWKDISGTDQEFINNADMDINVGIKQAMSASGGNVNYGNGGGAPSILPTASQYNGPSTGAHGTKNIQKRFEGTDKWNDVIYKVSVQRGINPLFVKCIMMTETSGQQKLISSAGAYGMMQVLRRDYNETKYDWNRMLTDPEYAINSGIDVIESKIQQGKTEDIYSVASRYYGGKANDYGTQIVQVYEGFGYNAKTDTVRSWANSGGGGFSGQVTVASDITDMAEVDVLIPIPKTNKEEEAVKQDHDNTNVIMKGMLHDMKKYSQRGSMNRAFPTYLLCFVDEGMWVDYRRLWNNYYTYHAVSEIMMVKERENPVHTLYLEMQNVYGALNHTDKAEYKAAYAATKFPGWNNLAKHPIDTLSWWWTSWFPSVTDDMVKSRMENISKSSFYLRAGARVHLRMGYGSVASMMPIVFNGRVTEVDNGDVCSVICQSDALELIQPYEEWANDKKTTWYSFRQEPKNVIDDLLIDRVGMDWLANYNGVFGFGKKGGTQSKYGIEHFGYVIGKEQDGFFKAFYNNTIRALWADEDVNGYDATKNIYLANGRGQFGDDESGGGDETNVHFWRKNKSPWDIMKLMAAISPDYEVKVHEHNFHSTVFYGQPQWYVKYSYYTTGDPAKLENYREAAKPSQQYHAIDSFNDIITNRMKTTESDLCTIVVPIYTWDDKEKAADTLFADPNIKPELQKTEIIDTSVLQDYPMLDMVSTVLRWLGNAAENTIQSLPVIGKWYQEKIGDLIDEDSRVERHAMQAGKTHIRMKFRSMYKGEILIIGDSAINPGDMVNVADSYSQIFGPVEVGKVVHMMSVDGGYTTSIKPELIAVQKDTKRGELLGAWWTVGTYFATVALRSGLKRYLTKKPLFNSALSKTTGLIRSIRNIRNTATAGAMAVSAAAGPPGWALILGELAMWAISEGIIQAIEAAIRQRRAGIYIMPVWYKNRPYVAGIDGHKELIPGYWDENIYGPYDSSQQAWDSQAISGGYGNVSNNLRSYNIPEGYSLCTPTLNHRKTAPFWQHRTPPAWPSSYYHKGVDYGGIKAGVDGDPVLSVANGKVIYASTGSGYGNIVVIEHTKTILFGGESVSKWVSGYAHLQSMNVRKGDMVNCGDVIGTMGHTTADSRGGRAYASGSMSTHLHFEIRKGSNENISSLATAAKYDPHEVFSKNNGYKFTKDGKGGYH